MANAAYTCKFCKKAFRRENTLAAHMCTKKKRWADRNTIAARLGYRVYQAYFFKTTNAKRYKTQEEFIDSQYYLSFVKFGRYLVELDPINSDEFIEYVITNGVALKEWTAPYVYETYLEERMRTEPLYIAIERTLLTMEEWAEKSNDSYSNFFKNAHVTEIVYYLRSGKISPWVLYLADTADDFYDRVEPEHLLMIEYIIDPIKWEVIMKTKVDDVQLVRETLTEANL